MHCTTLLRTSRQRDWAVELTLIKENKTWKVDGIAMLKFVKRDLSNEDDAVPTEA